MTKSVNATSVYSVDPRSAATFALPDTGNGEAPYDVRGADRITVLVDNGADQSVDVAVEQYAFNDGDASGPEYPVDGSSETIAAGEQGEISIDVSALAYLRLTATYSTAPSAGTLTSTYQADRAG